MRESAIHAGLPFSEHVPEKEEVYSNGRPESGEYGCDFTFIFVTDLLTNLYPAGIYLLKINNRNTRTRCKKCSKLTIKTPEQN